jgi:hypothetical protein
MEARCRINAGLRKDTTMAKGVSRPKQGTAHHIDPERGPFGGEGRVYRYESGANTHNVRQKAPSAPEPGETSGHGASAGPHKSGSTGK